MKKTHASGQRLAEAQKINQSLSSLGLVIYALSNGQKVIETSVQSIISPCFFLLKVESTIDLQEKSGFIPYRNSKLTRLLETWSYMRSVYNTFVYIHIYVIVILFFLNYILIRVVFSFCRRMCVSSCFISLGGNARSTLLINCRQSI